MKPSKKTTRLILIAAGLILIAFIGGRLTGSSAPASESEHDHATEQKAGPEIWTCSMHPQIKMPKPGKCPLCSMDLILLESSADDEGGEREVAVSAYAAKLMELETYKVDRRFENAEVRMVGNVDYDETRVSYISSWVAGRIDRLFVDYTGVPVKKGDHLAELYSPELLTAQEELIQAIQTLEKLKNSDSTYLLETAEKTIVAAREKLRLWGFTTEQIAEIEKRGTPAEHMTIYSPGSGIVIHKNAQEGMYVKTGTRIYTIADLSTVWIQLDAYESDLNALRYGSKVDFTTEAAPGETFTGTISFIDPIVSPATRTAKVRVIVENPTLKLKPGMFVRAIARPTVAADGHIMNPDLAGKWISPMHPEVIKDGPGSCDVCGMPLVPAESLGYVDESTANAPLLIPVTAALKTGKRAIVYVQIPNKEKPTYEGREILLGRRLGNFYVVKRGLEAGERVVTRGAFKLDAELQIQAKPSMMTPEGGGGGGMDMGGGDGKEKMSDEEMATMGTPTVRLPMASKMQFEAVQTAAKAALDALGQKERNPKPLFQTLEKALSNVDATALPPALQPLWKEADMLLGNDAAEGQMMVSRADADALASQLGDHLKSFEKKMGLGMKPMKPKAIQVPDAFRQQLDTAVQAYFGIHAALAGDKAGEATSAAQTMQAKLQAVQMELLDGDAHMLWMKQLETLNTALGQIAKAPSIEKQREAFFPLSKQLAAVLQVFPPLKPVNQAFCPMAFDNAGATWLQQSEEIANPYFGTAMSTCGEIQSTLGTSK